MDEGPKLLSGDNSLVRVRENQKGKQSGVPQFEFHNPDAPWYKQLIKKASEIVWELRNERSVISDSNDGMSYVFILDKGSSTFVIWYTG